MVVVSFHFVRWLVLFWFRLLSVCVGWRLYPVVIQPVNWPCSFKPSGRLFAAIDRHGSTTLNLWKCQLSLITDFLKILQLTIGYATHYLILLDQELLLFNDLVSQGDLVLEEANEYLLLLRLVFDLPLFVNDLLFLHCHLVLLYECQQVVLVGSWQISSFDLSCEVATPFSFLFELALALLFFSEVVLG